MAAWVTRFCLASNPFNLTSTFGNSCAPLAQTTAIHFSKRVKVLPSLNITGHFYRHQTLWVPNCTTSFPLSPRSRERQKTPSEHPLARFGLRSKAIAPHDTGSADMNRGASIPSRDVRRMRMEFHYAPYRSLQIKLQDMAFEKLNEPVTCCIVYIRSFNNSGHDFVYCVPKNTNLTKFYGGTFGAHDYQGPIFAAPVVLAGAVIERVGPINWRNYIKVPKFIEKVNGIRWRYLYATAKRAWSLMSFEASDLPVLEAMLADVPVQQQSPEPEARLPDAISDSKYPPEAQRIAIRQNVELLKKKPDHQDRIFEYLEVELTGRANRQGKDELTQQQYSLVERLRDNADDFDILYTDEDEEGNNIRKADFSREEEAHLISERDVIIQQILDQLALPINVRDDSDDSDLPGLNPSGMHGAPKATGDGSGSDEDNLLGDATQITRLQADLIQRFAEFTSASPHQCEGYLSTANWNLELAMSYFVEDQERSRPSVVRNTDTPGPKEQVEAVTTFKALTNADSVIASSYLTNTGWDVGRAVSIFFDDAEALGNNSKDADESLNAPSSKLSAKINEKSVRQIPPYSDAKTRPAGEYKILGVGLKASIRRRIAELDAEITRLDKQLKDMDDDGLDTIMRDVAESEKDPNEDSGLNTGPKNKLRIVNEDPSPAVTYRNGLSHAGLPLVLDEARNVVSYKRPTGTPYQQYLAMRLRLQVQHYGHEVVPSDDDPHRGIPTRERCPAPLVQEEVIDSSFSSDDIITPSEDAVPPASQETAKKTDQAQRRRAAMKEMVELMDMVSDSQTTESTKSIKEADAADALTRLKNQLPSNWAEQASQAIQHVTWQGGAVGEAGEETDSLLFDSEDEYIHDAPNTNNVDQEKRAPIKPALRDTSQPRKPSRKVRFNLSDEEREVPTIWDERSEEVEEKTPKRGRSILRGTRRSERLRLKAQAQATESEKDKTGTRDDQASEPVGGEVEGERETQESRAKGQNFKLEVESDVDAEGEEEEVEPQQEEELKVEQVQVQQEKDKRPPRVDEKMED